jgi:hypothetical protein
MGDLEELAASRSRLWFWIEYLRTLISLGWRTGGSAFILAFVCVRFMYGTVIQWLMNHRAPTLMQAGLFGVYNLHVRIITWNISMVMAQVLCFATPFVVIRFGLRNRLTQLACALFVIGIPFYTLRPWVMDLSGLLSVLIIAAVLVATPWRKPLAILAGTCLSAIAVKVIYLFLLPSVFHHRHIPWMPSSWVDATSFAFAAIVCVYLHHWLLQRPVASDRTIA